MCGEGGGVLRTILGVIRQTAFDQFRQALVHGAAGAEARGHVTFVEGSIGDAELVRQQMRGIDYLYHEAALRITHCAAEPREAHAVMFTGTFNVLEAAVQAGVKKVVAASSASV